VQALCFLARSETFEPNDMFGREAHKDKPGNFFDFLTLCK